MANRVSVFCRSKKYYPFIMKVNSGSDSQITIPTTGTGYNYDLRVQGGQDWYGLTGNHTINFPSASTDYFIEISGEFPHIYINNNSEKHKFLDVVQCGDIKWKSFQLAFYGCANLQVSATDVPDLSNVTDMDRMFLNCTSLATLDVSLWNVSSVTNMQQMFLNCTSLATLDVSNWNVSSVTNMRGMFDNCPLLSTLDVSNWNVSSVTNMIRMFLNCTSLATLDVSLWNVSSVTNMSSMFNGCTSLTTLDVSNWNVSSVTNMSSMFRLATSFIVDVDFTSSYNVTNISGFMNAVHTIHNVRLDCSSVVETGGVEGNLQPFGPLNDSSNANIELHNLPVNIWFNNSNTAANLTSGVTFYNMILTFDHSASAIITMTSLQKNNLLSYLQANVNPAYITLQDWLTDIGSNWTIA